MPRRKLSQESSLATAKSTLDDLLAMRERLNQTSADFLKVDVQTSLTFCEIAHESQNLKKRLRNRQHARQGYDTILHLMDKVDLSKEDALYLAENMEKLKSCLMNLGEAF